MVAEMGSIFISPTAAKGAAGRVKAMNQQNVVYPMDMLVLVWRPRHGKAGSLQTWFGRMPRLGASKKQRRKARRDLEWLTISAPRH